MKTRERLQQSKFEVGIVGRCIVIPGRDREAYPSEEHEVSPNREYKSRQATVVGESGSGKDSSVKVLELQGSLREHPERAREDSPCNQDALRPVDC